MGQVFKGYSPGGRPVAIKIVHQHLLEIEPNFRARFRREIEAAKRVGGFWTAQVVDGDAEAAAPWYASAFIDGRTLREVIDQDGVLSTAQAIELGAGLAEALAAIHQAGLVHRDLKPSNILIAADGPRVIDFGIVRSELGTGGFTVGTPNGMLVGTPGYLSPEQLEGRPATAASDVFALGSLLVFATTQRLPYPGPTDAAVLANTLHAEPDLQGVPAALTPVVAECLAREPDDRPSVTDLLDMLNALRDAAAPPTVPATTPAAVTSSAVPRNRPAATRQLPGTRVAEPAAPAGQGPTDPAPVGAPEQGGASGPSWAPPPRYRVTLAGAVLGVTAGCGFWWLVDVVAGGLAALVLIVLGIAVVSRDVKDAGGNAAGDAVIPAVVLGFLGFGICGLIVSIQRLNVPWWWHIGSAIGTVIAASGLMWVLVIITDLVDHKMSIVAAGWGCLLGIAGTFVLIWTTRQPIWVTVAAGAGTALVLALVLIVLLRGGAKLPAAGRPAGR